MSSPLGTPSTYFETGSPKRNFPSWTSSTITAAVIVLVFEAAPEMRIGARRGRAAQLRRAAAESEIVLRRAQQNHGPRQQKLLGCRLDDALMCDRLERLEICGCLGRPANGAPGRQLYSRYRG
jgi:hypothetical protein